MFRIGHLCHGLRYEGVFRRKMGRMGYIKSLACGCQPSVLESLRICTDFLLRFFQKESFVFEYQLHRIRRRSGSRQPNFKGHKGDMRNGKESLAYIVP